MIEAHTRKIARRVWKPLILENNKSSKINTNNSVIKVGDLSIE